MTTSMPPSKSGQFGKLVDEFPARSGNRIIIIALAIICLLIGLTGNLLGTQLDTFPRLIFVALAAACLVQLFYQRGAGAQIFQNGFIIARAGNTLSGRWEDIANITHKAYRSHLYGIIPLPGSVTHTYVIIMKNGQQMSVYSTYYTNGERLGDTIDRMWTADAVKRNANPQ